MLQNDRSWGCSMVSYPDNKVHGANMGPTWVLSAPGGPHIGPMNPAIWVVLQISLRPHGHCHTMPAYNKNMSQNSKYQEVQTLSLSMGSQHWHSYIHGIYTNTSTHWGRDKMAAIFQTTFSNGFSWMKLYEFWLKISLKFVPRGRINNILALVQIMAWRQQGDKPLSEPMMVSSLTHICVIWPQWVNNAQTTINTAQFL